jgi:hypothetical protein
MAKTKRKRGMDQDPPIPRARFLRSPAYPYLSKFLPPPISTPQTGEQIFHTFKYKPNFVPDPQMSVSISLSNMHSVHPQSPKVLSVLEFFKSSSL